MLEYKDYKQKKIILQILWGKFLDYLVGSKNTLGNP